MKEILTGKCGQVSTEDVGPSKKCPICLKRFLTLKEARQHMKRVHDPTKKWPCEVCGKKYKSKRLVKVHYQKIHLGLLRPTKSYECFYCGRAYPSKASLADHISSTHTGEKLHVCPICERNCCSVGVLKRHMRTHEKEGPKRNSTEEFVETGVLTLEDWERMVKSRVKACPLCNKLYNTAKDMRRHILEVHSKAKTYQCDECLKYFKSSRHVMQHKRRVHLGIKKAILLNFECFHCGAKFNSKTHLADHMTSHTGIKRHVCYLCNSSYTTSRGLRRHNKNHLRDAGALRPDDMFKCDKCGKMFIEHSEMVKHRDWVHGDKCYLCKICGARVKGNLKAHMMIHTGEKPVCCHICGKKLRCKLKDHMLTHTGERPFGCEVCGSTFKYKYYLGVHMRKHSGERPYVCSYCGHTFAARPAYNLHVKKHAERKDVRVFECQVCKSRFSSEDQMNVHLAEHFGGLPFQNV